MSRGSVRAAAGFSVAAGQVVARTAVAVLGCLLGLTLLPVLIGWRPYVVVSGSMTPQIRPGDVVVAKPVQPSVIQPGHVIVFTDPSRPDRMLVHRVITVNADGTFTTKGDANGTPDSAHVQPSAVHGMGRLRIPYVGLFPYWQRNSQWGLVALTAGGLALLVLFGQWHRRDDYESDEQDDDTSESDAGHDPDSPGRHRVGAKPTADALESDLVSAAGRHRSQPASRSEQFSAAATAGLH